MVDAELLGAAGLYVVPAFLDPELCRRIREEVARAGARPAMVSKFTATGVVDPRVRRNTRADVSIGTQADIEGRFEALTPTLARQFGEPLGEVQRAQFLVYREGDFFGRHADSLRGATVPPHVRSRRISAVLFLNRESEVPVRDTFGGGRLLFCDLPDPEHGHRPRRVALPAEEGLLVAFPSTLWHEVSPVTRGQRFSVVTWYTAACSAFDGAHAGH